MSLEFMLHRIACSKDAGSCSVRKVRPEQYHRVGNVTFDCTVIAISSEIYTRSYVLPALPPIGGQC